MKFYFLRIPPEYIMKVIIILIENWFTVCSALYRIPLELLKIGNNETLTFWACFWPFLNCLNYKKCLLAAVNFCHWRFSFIFYLRIHRSIFDYFWAQGPLFCLHSYKEHPLEKYGWKNYFCRYLLLTLQMKKVHRITKIWFMICEILIKSQGHSKKFHFIMLFPNFALTMLS